MTLEAFFKKFELISDVPDVVGTFRGLILELAVRGKLATQDASDESATQLLERVFDEKSNRIGSARRSKRIPDQITNDIFKIPDSWEWTDATSPAIIVSDRGKKVKTQEVSLKGAFPVVDQGKVFIRGYCDDSEKVIRVTDPIVLFGDHTRETKFIDFDFIVGADGVKLLQPVCIDPQYYYLVLRWLPLDSRGYGRHFKLLKACQIPLPPLAEQKRIVAKVDELMALCDQLEAQQQERDKQHAALARASLARFANDPTPDNLQFLFHRSYDIDPKDLRKSILILAVRGKLVPQDESINAPIINDGSLSDSRFDIPNNWTWAQIDDLQPEFHNGASSRGDKDGEPVVVLRLADIKNRNIALDAPRKIAISPNQIDKYGLQLGDILITRVNGSADIVGSFIPVQEDISAIYCDHFIRMRIDKELMEPGYMTLAGESQLVRDQIRSLFITTAGQKTVNQGHIRSLQIPLPPLAEQRRIVAKVEQLMALVDELETQLASSHEVAKNLLEALVAELTAA